MCSGPPSASSRAIVSSRAPAVDRRSPEPLQDELEERKLDRLGAGNRCPGGAAALDEGERARCRRVDTASTSAGSTVYGGSSGGRRRFHSRTGPSIASRAAVRLEVLHPHVVREQAWNVALEAVELGQGVLADREQEVHSRGSGR